MSIEKQLESNYRASVGVTQGYLQNPDIFMEIDVLEFSKAVGAKATAAWARNQHMETSYNVAKKIIESIN